MKQRLFGAAHALRQKNDYLLCPSERDADLARLRDSLGPRLSDVHSQGQRLSVSEAEAHARRGQSERGRPPDGWDSLTPTEI